MATGRTDSEHGNHGDGLQLRLRSVSDLLKERFFVPSYQRGYRWTARQVEALLDDLEAFQRTSRQGSPDAFYCLQPVVVCRPSEGAAEFAGVTVGADGTEACLPVIEFVATLPISSFATFKS